MQHRCTERMKGTMASNHAGLATLLPNTQYGNVLYSLCGAVGHSTVHHVAVRHITVHHGIIMVKFSEYCNTVFRALQYRACWGCRLPKAPPTLQSSQGELCCAFYSLHPRLPSDPRSRRLVGEGVHPRSSWEAVNLVSFRVSNRCYPLGCCWVCR